MEVSFARMAAAGLGAALAVLGAAAPGAAQDVVAMADDELPADSQSIGYTDDGQLEHPFALESSDRLVSVTRNHYGTRELVGLLYRAADAVARKHPGSILGVGDLSAETGGHLAPHGSHQSGRDADVGFYVTDDSGREVPRGMFREVAADGSVRGPGGYHFDEARNWALLVAFVDDPMAEVQYVLIESHLRQRLLDYAHSIDAPEDQIHRVEIVTKHIRGSENHDDHFHVRIYCSIGDRPQCLDEPPLHPWYYGTPSPDAVAAARVADLQRAAALRRAQRQQRRAIAELLRGQALAEERIEIMARELAREPSRQELAERRRAARLTRDERRALMEQRQAEAELRREEAAQQAAEHGRAADLAAEERRWEEAERRRAARLRANARRFAERERRRAAELRTANRRARALLRRAERQRAADRRRARQLLERSERLGRERARAVERQQR